MTTETLCVPRELLRVACFGGNEAWQALEELRALLAQPVASEPVGYFTFCEDKQAWKQGKPKGPEFLHLFTPLYRRPPAPAIPQGYALVPIELTSAMLEAGWAEERDIQKNEGTAWDFRSNNRLLNIYRAMLNAAPQPTEGSTDE